MPQTRLALLATVILLAAAFAPLAGSQTSGESFSFDDDSGEWIFELEAPEGAETVQLGIVARIRSGSVSWTLLDPAGEARLRARGTSGNLVGDTGPIEDPPAGTWKLQVTVERAKGYARFRWSVD